MANISIEQPSDADLDVIHAAFTETYWSPAALAFQPVASPGRLMEIRINAPYGIPA